MDHTNTTDLSTYVFAERPIIISLRYVTGIVGILANFLVAFVFLYNNIHKKSVTHLLILHQSILDLLGCIFFPAFYNSPIHADIRGSIICRFRTSFFYFLSASTQNLLMLTIERYVAVIHPRRYFQNSKSSTKRTFILIMPHLISILTGIQLAIYADFDPEHSGSCDYFFPGEALAKWSAGIIFLTFWLIPVVVMSFCYIRIFRTLHDRSSKNSSLTPSSKHKQRRRDLVERNVIVTLLLIYLAFLITLTPNVVYYLIHSLCDCLHFKTSLVHDITVLLNAVNLAINPFIYAFKFRDFKAGFNVLVRKISGGTSQSNSEEVEMASFNHGLSLTDE